MKTLFLLYMFLCLWVVALGNKHENIGLERPGKTDGVVLLTLSGDKLPFPILGGVVDHTDVEVVSLAPFDKPDTHIRAFLSRVDNAHLPVNAPRNRGRKVCPVYGLNGDGFISGIVGGKVLPEAGHGQYHEQEYGKQPFHAANIAKN